MNLTPEFLDSYQVSQLAVEPQEVEGDGQLRIQSFWGFDSIPTSTKAWLVGNTIQIHEPAGDGKARLWEVNTSISIPYDSERIEMAGRTVPAFAGEDLDVSMQELGYGDGQWKEGWPMLTYEMSPDTPTAQALLEQIHEMAMSVEVG